MGENRFVSSDKDLEDLKISPELRSRMGFVLFKVKRIFPIIYRDMERILNTPYEQLVEMAEKAKASWPKTIARYGPKEIFTALDFLRNNQQKIHIASIPIQGISIYGNLTTFTIVTVPEPRGPSRSAIYDILPSQCIMLFHPVSSYMPERYLGSAIISGIANCMGYIYEGFSPYFFTEAMAVFSGITRPEIVPKIWLDEKGARHMINDLKRIGARLVLESFLYDKILDTEYLSRLLLDKSIIENIPPVR